MDKILVADDEKDIRDIIEIYLINEGYEVYTACDGLEVVEKIKEFEFNLLILDIMMPNLDGIRACMEIRKNNDIPIIMLSAKTEDKDKILGLNVGADDYLTKPFNPLELVARVKSNLRRIKALKKYDEKYLEEIVIDDLVINKATKEVFVAGEFKRLTPKEFSILEFLAANRGRVLSTKQIYENAWDEPFYNGDNTVAVHIRNIREKIEINPKEPKYIKLVWGMGYKIEK